MSLIDKSFWLSLQVASTAMLGVLVIGIATGWWLARSQFRGKTVLNICLLLPLVLPPTVIGYYLVALFKPQSWISQLVGGSPMFHWTGAALAAGVVAFPLMLQSARAAFETVPETLLEAAATLGKNPWQCFWQVALPLARSSLLAGAILSFGRALGEFGATLMLAGNIAGQTQTMPLAIYEALLAGQNQRAWHLVGVLTLFSWLILWISLKLNPVFTRDR